MRGDRDVGGDVARPGRRGLAAQDLPACAPRCLLPNLQQRDFGAAFCSRVRTRSEGYHSNVYPTGIEPHAWGDPKKRPKARRLKEKQDRHKNAIASGEPTSKGRPPRCPNRVWDPSAVVAAGPRTPPCMGCPHPPDAAGPLLMIPVPQDQQRGCPRSDPQPRDG